MEASRAKAGVQLAGIRELLLPLTVAACFVLYYLAELPFGAVVSIAAPMLVLYALAPAWAARSLAAFDRDVVRLLSSGRRAALPGRFARAVGMRLFSPPALVAERRGVVAAESDRPAEARAGFRSAMLEYGPAAPLRVLLGYAHACYALGDDAEAIRVYRQLLEQQGALPGVKRNLAHAMVRRGQFLREALELIDRVEGESEDPQRRGELSLVRALAHAKLGEHERAQALLDDHVEVQGELADHIREQVAVEREGGTLVRG
jgi:tetratricopeptide (TPR) repeat protein